LRWLILRSTIPKLRDAEGAAHAAPPL